MSVKRYVKERHTKRELLLEIKKMIIEESSEEMKTFEILNVNTVDEVMRQFINIGNMSYFCGDNDAFEYFIESLFDIVNAEPNGIDSEELIKRIYHYSLMSAQNYDIIAYSVILNNIKKNILKLTEAQPVNQYLMILKDLAVISVSNNLKAGIMEALHAFRGINDHFVDNKMHINRMYLKNIIISIVYSAEKSRHEKLKDTLLAESSEILGFPNPQDQPITPFTGTAPIIEEVETPKQAT